MLSYGLVKLLGVTIFLILTPNIKLFKDKSLAKVFTTVLHKVKSNLDKVTGALQLPEKCDSDTGVSL